ncbi:hypothetical protein ACGF0J_36305 [Nonomuraea sp. NPDC047897]|uniref:AMP-binding enzyme n=1 Tax=Nonomuraea sp. NPDC047897 TaxID=3364346 RepID=UPI0037213007
MILGRADQQVKIRGHRVELGEIEAALGDAPGVARAVAVVSEGRLMAEVVPESVDLDAVRAHAATHLPEHMRPDPLAALPLLPLSANVKVDRAAVAKLSASAAPVEPVEAPRGNSPGAFRRAHRRIDRPSRRRSGGRHAVNQGIHAAARPPIGGGGAGGSGERSGLPGW